VKYNISLTFCGAPFLCARLKKNWLSVFASKIFYPTGNQAWRTQIGSNFKLEVGLWPFLCMWSKQWFKTWPYWQKNYTKPGTENLILESFLNQKYNSDHVHACRTLLSA